jgi:hypothetical protein
MEIRLAAGAPEPPRERSTNRCRAFGELLDMLDLAFKAALNGLKEKLVLGAIRKSSARRPWQWV